MRGEQIDGGTPAVAGDALQLSSLPAFSLTSLTGATIDNASLMDSEEPAVREMAGKAAGVFYGAPPDLHDKVEKLLATLLAR